MPSCGVYNCTSRTAAYATGSEEEKHTPGSDKLSFFAFPKDPKLCKEWIESCRRDDWEPSKWSRVCSKHFSKKDIIKHDTRYALVKGAIPSIFDFPLHLKKLRSNRKVPMMPIMEDVSEEDEVFEAEEEEDTQELEETRQFHIYCLMNDHTYAMPNTLDKLAEELKLARICILGLHEKNNKLSLRLKTYKGKNKILAQKARRLEKRVGVLKNENMKQKFGVSGPVE